MVELWLKKDVKIGKINKKNLMFVKKEMDKALANSKIQIFWQSQYELPRRADKV